MVPPRILHTTTPAADASAHHRHTELLPSATAAATTFAVTGMCVLTAYRFDAQGSDVSQRDSTSGLA